MMTLILPIHARRALLILAGIAVCLALQSITMQYLFDRSGEASDTFISVYAQLTNSNLESSIPTWFASALLLFCAILLAVIALAKHIHQDKYARHWLGLAVIFLYMSLDEGAMIHEELTDPLRAIFNASNYLYFAWMIVGIPVALTVALIYSRFVLDLPPHIRKLFILAGCSYIGGAVVIEAFSANMWYLNDGASLPYMIVGTIEELFEMLGAITLIYALLLHIGQIELTIHLTPSPMQAAIPVATEPRTSSIELPRRRVAIIVLCAGVNLTLLQWILIRELSTLPFAAESLAPLFILITCLSLAIGYRLSRLIPQSWLLPLGATTLLLHLSLPLWLRLLVVIFENAGASTLAWVLLPALSPLIAAGFLSIFLPRMAQGNPKQLIPLYALLLPGASGAGVLLIMPGLAAQTIYIIYALGIVLSMLAFRVPRRLVGLFAAGSVAWIVLFPRFDYATNTLLFRTLQRLPTGTQTLFSGYSRYQKVDILQAPEGERFLYLDGRAHFESDTDPRLNTFMGTVPAMLVEPDNALVLGAGSMQMERLVANHAGHVTTIDSDSLVIQASLEYFDDFNLMSSLANRTIIIDDPQRYIANTSAQYDMMSTDVYAGELTLFYQSASERLAPGGILVTDLSGVFGSEAKTPHQIAAALTSVFDEVMIITPVSAGSSIAYAANSLPFTRDKLSAALRSQGETEFIIFEPASVQAIIDDAGIE